MIYTCPCCGYLSLTSEIFDICDICFWEDDPICRNEPDFIGGANGYLSLRQAQLNFSVIGACDKAFLKDVRKPNIGDKKDPNWRPY